MDKERAKAERGYPGPTRCILEVGIGNKRDY